ncbi:MAG: ATP-binding protein, partial [Patescibacteria group bacterium]
KLREFTSSQIKYYPKNILDLKLEAEAVNILSGPRQTGKSTALKLLIRKLLEQKFPPERIFYFNCDALSSRKDIIDLVLSFLNGIRGSQEVMPANYLFLDEISSVIDWPYAVKWLADGGFFANSKMILTGSSSISLKKTGEFLPGRRKKGRDIRYLPIDFRQYSELILPEIFTGQPLKSYREVEQLSQQLTRKRVNLPQLYRNFLLTGGFLKMINSFIAKEPFFDTVEIYKSSLKSELAKAGKKELFARKVLEKVVNSLTSETSYTNVAEEAELGSKNTAADYLSFFSDTFMLMETLFYNILQKRAVLKKNKKYYPTDPFLFWIFNSFISGSSEIGGFYQKYSSSPLDSQITESFVASELFKHGHEFYFFRNTKELDFYVPKLEFGIEVKYKNKIVSSDLEGLRYAKRKIVVSKHSLEKRDDILIIPVYLFGLIDLAKISL